MNQQFNAAPMPFQDRGQATRIEQSRAQAEVMTAVMAAKQCPRDPKVAQAAMQFACRQPSLAQKAFYSYPRGGETVTGPSIHLARELALIWGNINYGVMELDRDIANARSEILAFAWDLESNARNSQIFIQPHRRDTKRGSKDLAELRDVYENNANNGARRVREAIYAVLPRWFKDEAEELCRETLKRGNGKSFGQRVAELVTTYGNVGVTLEQLETKAGCPRERWTDREVVDLEITYRSVERGEIRRDEAFPPQRQTVQEITRSVPAPASQEAAPADDHAAALTALRAHAEQIGRDWADVVNDFYTEHSAPPEELSVKVIRAYINGGAA
jgi:hypothetical protein